ncbi:hypothetical protein INT45_002317, partial [Circinella minor]
RYFAGCTGKVHGKMIETQGKLSYTIHESNGVCCDVIPWNSPLAMLSWKIAPALAMSNAVVIKTSKSTPLSALRFASLAPGVINIIIGYVHITGDLLARHNRVFKIAFTGSTTVGRLIMKAGAKTNLKKVTLELRGSRIYVQEGIYDQFIEKFKALAAFSTVGNPYDKKKLFYIETGKSEGVTCVLGGNRVGDAGYFIESTIFTDVTPKMKIMQENIIGPVVATSKFKDVDDVIEMAQDTDYGLAAAVFTSSLKRAITVSNRLEAGTCRL